jgi:hypothetical protein
MQDPDNVQRKVQPDWAGGPPMSNKSMPKMLGVGILFAAIMGGVVFYNATSDHPATATNVTAAQHTGSPPNAAPTGSPQ